MDFDQFVQDDSLRVNAKDTVVNIKRLVSFLQNNTGIKKLFLANSDIGDEGVRELANANLINLTSLHLEWNRIGDKGAKALAKGNLTNLTSLNLKGSKVGDEGAKALAKGNLTNLTSLDLEWKGSNVSKWAIVQSTLSAISAVKHSTTLQASSK